MAFIDLSTYSTLTRKSKREQNTTTWTSNDPRVKKGLLLQYGLPLVLD
jgi:hypothetical protein